MDSCRVRDNNSIRLFAWILVAYGMRIHSGGSLMERLIDHDVQDEAAGVLKTLAPSEEKVIRMRFGIGCDREHTLEEIARDFGLTRERIRQIESKVLQRLRSSENAERLRPLMTIQ